MVTTTSDLVISDSQMCVFVRPLNQFINSVSSTVNVELTNILASSNSLCLAEENNLSKFNRMTSLGIPPN